MLNRITVFILRQNKSIKRIKLSTGKTKFTYKKGKYYLQDRGCFLKGRKIYSLYFEDIPNPIAFDNIIKQEKNDESNDANLNIDSSVIKDMTEKDFLSALTETAMDKTQILYLFVAVISIILSVGTLYLVYKLYELAGL